MFGRPGVSPSPILCPACLTPRRSDEAVCAACGAVWTQRRSRTGWFVAAAVLVAGAAAVVAFRDRAQDAQPQAPSTTGADEPAREAPPPSSEAPPATTPSLSPEQWRALVQIDGTQHPALAIRGRNEQEVYLLLSLRAATQGDGPPSLVADPAARIGVVTWAAQPPYLLLLAQSARALPFAPPPVRASEQLAPGEWVVAPRFGRAQVTGRTEAGLLQLSGSVPEEEVLVDAQGRAVGLAAGDVALPVDPILLWLGQPATLDLERVRTDLRERDPAHLANRAAELVRDGSIAACEQALRLLDQAVALERRRENLELLTRHQVAARAALARAWLERDPARALAEVRAAMAAHPGQPSLLELAVQVAVRAGDAAAALAWYRGVPAAAQPALGEWLADGLASIARGLLQQQRAGEAWDVLEEGLLLFPTHDGLLAAQRLATARRPAPATSDRSGVVEIPFDPDTHSIQTQVTVGSITVPMIVDTGATLTTIPTAVAQRLGLLAGKTQRVKIETASGTVEGQIVRLPEIRIGELRIQNARAVVHDLPGGLAGSGLLGLNVLGRLDLQIDSRRHRLILRQDVPKRHR